ncbi:MAG: hypothetical protein JXR58_00555 [Bacteroidales bacterium]|nr:hypothetical protein [Bacteroidales bacterium]
MKENQNIEDIFRKAAEKYKVEPNEKVWNNVEKEIWNNNFFNRLHEILNKYSVVPGTHVWNNVQRKLAYLMFFRFSWTSMNIYYTSALLLIAGSLFFMNDFSEENTTKGQIVKNDYPELNISREVFQKNTGDNYDPALSSLVSGLNDKNNNETKKIDNKTINNEIIDNSNNLLSENKNPSKEKIINILPEKQIVNEDKEVLAENNTKDNKFDSSEKNSINNNTTIKYLDNDLKEFEPKFIAVSYEEENISLLSENKYFENDSVLFSEIIIPYKDTVGKDAKGNDIIIETTHWSADIFWNPSISTSKFTSINPESIYYTGLRNFAEQKNINLKNLGLNFNYSFKQLIIQSGFEYLEIINSTMLETNYDFVEANTEQAVFPTTNFYVDTYTFLNLDSLLAGVEYEITAHDTIWQQGFDTIDFVVYDTITRKTQIETQGKYTYLELPLIFGYEFERRNFVFTPKVGIITGFMYKTNGYQPGFTDFSTPETIRKANYEKLHFSAYFSLGLSYKIGNRLECIADPYLRYSLSSLTGKETGVSQKLSATGIKLGLRYYFNQ